MRITMALLSKQCDTIAQVRIRCAFFGIRNVWILK